MNILFEAKDERRRRIYDRNIQKYRIRIIPADIHEINKKLIVTVQPKNACKLEFADHLWLPFLYQQQSDIVFFFSVITFKIYHILESKWKHGIGPIDIIKFNG